MLEFKNKLIDNKKLKVYLDTTVISYLRQDDAIDKTKVTNDLWEKFKLGTFDICLSDLTMLETSACDEPKASYLKDRLGEIYYKQFPITEEVVALAKEIVSTGILTENNMEDCQHIAVALINGCDVILSWNFKHLVNVKTINGVRAISLMNGYKNINILTPTVLLEMEI